METKVYVLVILATIFEAIGDAVIRISLHSEVLSAGVGLFLPVAMLLAVYGTALNLGPGDFGTITGLYVGMVFISFQVTNYTFKAVPHTATPVGGALIVAGSAVIYIWR